MRTICVLCISPFILNPSSASGLVEYTVQPGDTLSTIAQSKVGEPVYPKYGSLARLLSVNKQLKKNDKIYPGQKLSLPVTLGIQSSSKELSDSSAQLPGLDQISPSTPTKEQDTSFTERTISSEDEIPHDLSLSASIGMTTFAAHDNQNGVRATLNSSRDLVIEGAWQQKWAKTFSSTFSARFRSIEFQSPVNSSYSLSDSKNNTLAISLGAQNQLSKNFSLSYSFVHGQELFLRGLSSTSVGVDEVALSRFAFGGKYLLYHQGKTFFGVKGSYEYLGAGSTDGYTIQSGSAYQAGLYLHRQYGADKTVEVHMGYRERAQKTSLVDAVEKTVFGDLIFSIPLFERSGEK